MLSVFDQVSEGLRVGIVIFSILVATFIASFAVNRLFTKVLYINLQMVHVDQTSCHFVRRHISTVIYIIGVSAALSQISEFKIIGHSLLAGAGILTIVGGLLIIVLLNKKSVANLKS